MFEVKATELAAQHYPFNGEAPTSMGNDHFLYMGYNIDGTQQSNPVVDAEIKEFNGVSYILKKLQNEESINFDTKNYIVYSVVPQELSIDYAYKNIRNYYDANSVKDLDINYDQLPPQLNEGKPTSPVNSVPEQTVVPGNNDQVFVINSALYIPNLPNSPGLHDGATANVYWSVDPYINRQGYQPNGPNYHMIGYGWSVESRDINKSIYLQNLTNDGGTSLGAVFVEQAQPPFNYFKKLVQHQYSVDNYLNTIDANKATYPFPKPNWLKHGIYMPLNPMPGFQRNFIRWYTPWGAWNLLNNTSDIFVRSDGSVELPAYQQDGTWKMYPLVRQTWDGTQRFTVINQTDNIVSEVHTSYPGDENYYPGTVFLPDSAGVLTSGENYTIYDGTATLRPREPDIWFGLKGFGPKDVAIWDDANKSEPGGQANKPYMAGGNISKDNNGQTVYTCRLQSSNSFMIANLSQEVQNNSYKASFYIDAGDGKYQLVATLFYTWQPWMVKNGKWESNNSGGSMVPQITAVDANYRNLVSYVSLTGGQGVYNGEQNLLGNTAYYYTILDVGNSPNKRFLIQLTN